MDLHGKFNGRTVEQRKGVLFLLLVAVAILFLMMPSASSISRAVALIRRFYPSAPKAKPVKPSPFDGRADSPHGTVSPQRVVEQPPVRTYVEPVSSPECLHRATCWANLRAEHSWRKEACAVFQLSCTAMREPPVR